MDSYCDSSTRDLQITALDSCFTMKVLIAFLICIVAAFGGVVPVDLSDHEVKSMEMLKVCVQELKLDPRLLYDESLARNLSLDTEACLKACVDKKLGLMNKDGTYNLERILSLMETTELKKKAKNKYHHKIKECVSIVGEDQHCKLAACVHGMPKSVYMKNDQ